MITMGCSHRSTSKNTLVKFSAQGMSCYSDITGEGLLSWLTPRMVCLWSLHTRIISRWKLGYLKGGLILVHWILFLYWIWGFLIGECSDCSFLECCAVECCSVTTKTLIIYLVLIQGTYFEWFEIYRKLQLLNQERNFGSSLPVWKKLK